MPDQSPTNVGAGLGRAWSGLGLVGLMEKVGLGRSWSGSAGLSRAWSGLVGLGRAYSRALSGSVGLCRA